VADLSSVATTLIRAGQGSDWDASSGPPACRSRPERRPERQDGALHCARRRASRCPRALAEAGQGSRGSCSYPAVEPCCKHTDSAYQYSAPQALEVTFQDGRTFRYPAELLRAESPSAQGRGRARPAAVACWRAPVCAPPAPQAAEPVQSCSCRWSPGAATWASWPLSLSGTTVRTALRFVYL